MQNYAELLK